VVTIKLTFPRTGLEKPDIREVCLLSPFLCLPQHPFLDIDRGNFTRRTHILCKGEREPARAATCIQYVHPVTEIKP
jgi:hypothetical protein